MISLDAEKTFCPQGLPESGLLQNLMGKVASSLYGCLQHLPIESNGSLSLCRQKCLVFCHVGPVMRSQADRKARGFSARQLLPSNLPSHFPRPVVHPVTWKDC